MDYTQLRLTTFGIILFILLLGIVVGIGAGTLLSFEYLNQRITLLTNKPAQPVICEVVIKLTPTITAYPTRTSLLTPK